MWDLVVSKQSLVHPALELQASPKNLSQLEMDFPEPEPSASYSLTPLVWVLATVKRTSEVLSGKLLLRSTEKMVSPALNRLTVAPLTRSCHFYRMEERTALDLASCNPNFALLSDKLQRDNEKESKFDCYHRGLADLGDFVFFCPGGTVGIGLAVHNNDPSSKRYFWQPTIPNRSALALINVVICQVDNSLRMSLLWR